MNLKTHIEQYLNYLKSENKSIKTLENYQHYLMRFWNWGKARQVSDITDTLIKKYKQYLSNFRDEKGKKLKKVTQNYHLIALRNFFRYLESLGTRVLDAKEVKLDRHEKWQVGYLDHKELKRLLKAADGKDLRSLRDRAILHILFSCGLRVSELCSLDKKQIDLDKGKIELKMKDGSRVIPLTNPAKKALADYLNKMSNKDKALFIRLPKGNKINFIKSNDLRLTPRSIQRIVKKYATKAGILKKVTPHLLRHTCGTFLFRKGKDLEEVQNLLGHASLMTTKVYKKAKKQ